MITIILKRLKLALIFSAMWLSACGSSSESYNDYGVVSEGKSIVQEVSFTQQIKPIFDSRCVACHSCYDAPCQLKMTAHAGVTRGVNKERVYQHQSLGEGPLSRLFFDAQSPQEWQQQGFSPVTAVPLDSGDQDQHQRFSSLVGVLDIKAADQSLISEKKELPIDDADTWQCSTDKHEFVDFAHNYPQRGMPYGLAAVTQEQQSLVRNWVGQGSIDDSTYELSELEKKSVARWEALLNQNSNKDQLIARYIYEHLFLAKLYFQGEFTSRYFQLVRSSTAPGTPIDVVATRRPFDAPGIDRVYYRLRLNKETTVAKTHMPYRLDDAKYENWQAWFYQPDYQVTKLPGYNISTASNPFKTFEQLPAKARYRFMLDEANFIVKGFIKGPVCKGQSAVNVIDEHFWVFFIDPEFQSGYEMTQYLATVKDHLDLPAEKEDTLNLLGAWDEFANKEKIFLEHRREFIKNTVNEQGIFDTKVIWDGDGENPNAALTIYRHFDNATVHQGLSGQVPKTSWVIDYPLLERIHYLLVAGYDVYGNVSHQLLSRIYMDFLRMEGESLFLLLLPRDDRIKMRAHWYRDAEERVQEFMALTDMEAPLKPAIEAFETQPKRAVFAELQEHLGSAIEQTYNIENNAHDYPAKLISQIKALQSVKNESFALLPEVTMLELAGGEKTFYVSLLKHLGHLNITSILFENSTLQPNETTVSVLPGMVGPRPNVFMSIELDKFGEFAQALQNLSSENDYTNLFKRYGVKRYSAEFWPTYDRFDTGFKQFSPIDYGVLDLNKLQDR